MVIMRLLKMKMDTVVLFELLPQILSCSYKYIGHQICINLYLNIVPSKRLSTPV